MSKDYIITIDPMSGAHIEHRSHKYISRKWKNGHWVYTYPDPSKHVPKSKLISANRAKYDALTAKQDSFNAMMKNQNDLQRTSREVSSIESTYKNFPVKLREEREKHKDLYEKHDKYGAKSIYLVGDYAKNKLSYEAASKIARSEQNAYDLQVSRNKGKIKYEIKKWESTPLSKIQTAVHKGIDKVNSLLKKISSKIKK